MKIEITKAGDRHYFSITEVNGYDDMLAVAKLLKAFENFDNIQIIDAAGMLWQIQI